MKTKYLFIPKGDEMVAYADAYGTPLEDTWVALDWKEINEKDIPDLSTESTQYGTIVVHDRSRGLHITIQKDGRIT